MIVVWVIAGLVVVMGFAAFFGAPYVPSHRSQVRRAFTKLRPLTSRDVVVDLGRGDGVVLRQAIHRGAGRAIGYEINPLLVWISRVVSAKDRTKLEVRTANMWRVRPPKGVTVVYIFGVGRDLRRLESLLERWATDLGDEIECIVYGHELPNKDPIKQEGAHRLYRFAALHRQQAQV